MKSCTNKQCNQVNPQPITNFSRNKASPDGLTYNCKSCVARISRQWHERNKQKHSEQAAIWAKKNPNARKAIRRKSDIKNSDKIRQRKQRWRQLNNESVRSSHLKSYFGITSRQYDELLESQNGLCAICGLPPTAFKRRLAVDHNHNTGAIRGLLCGKCNTAIGSFDDSINKLLKAAQYLQRGGQ